MRRHFLALLAAAALAASCTASAERSPYFGQVRPPDGQVFRYVDPEPESLDPQIGTGQPEARKYEAIWEGLTDYHPRTGQSIPAIAERWHANDDNSEFIFELRHNARFSDGRPITASDF